MKYLNKLLFLSSFVVLGMTACDKVDELAHFEEGNAVELTASKTAVTPTPADSLNSVISFSWTSPNYATDTSTMKYVLEIDSTGRSFSHGVTRTVSGVSSTSLTGKELNAILLNYGFALGEPYELDVRVFSSYGNNNERYVSNTIKISVTPYNDPSVLTSTESSVELELATASQHVLDFNWSPSFNGYTGVVNYVIQFDSASRDFANAQDIPIGNSIYSKAMTQGDINGTALNSDIIGGTTGTVEYRVKATTAQGAVSYSAPIQVEIRSYVSILRFYLPGSYQIAGGYGAEDWKPETAPELIRDLRPGLLNNMYYIYIYLPAGASFKVTQGRSWDVNFGGTGGTLVQNSPDNLSVSTAGYYRITVDRNTMKYDIREGRMGFVGGGTGAGWTPANSFPNYAMGAAATNLFVGLTNLTGDQWKMIDWTDFNNGSNTVDEPRSYGTPLGSGSTMEVNGNNFSAVSVAGRYRVIWDGRDVDNIKYEMSPATEMRIAGDGIDEPGVNDWDPGSSPQMVYSGNGVWTATIKLKANKSIKFVAGNAWGAFDYEDNSGQSNATGVQKAIVWNGNKDFVTPSVAGTYTITLNEYTQQMTIN